VTGLALFSPDWAAAFESELADDPGFRPLDAAWGTSLLLVLAPEAGQAGEERALFLDLAHGGDRRAGCSVRPAVRGDSDAARLRVSGPVAAWQQLLRGEIEPSAALMSGRLRLERGSLLSLLPHLEASRRIFAAARRTAARFDAALQGDPLTAGADLR